MKFENFSTISTSEMKANSSLKSFRMIMKIHERMAVLKWAKIGMLLVLIASFLPWTQSLDIYGKVSSLRQEDRPQKLNSIIPGRIKKWYVNEGALISKGDTILQIAEIKEEYFDVKLLDRIREQLNSKIKSQHNYLSKAETASAQYEAIKKARDLKMQILNNKIEQQNGYIMADSIALTASNTELEINKRQIEAAKNMLDQGVISLAEYEKRKANHQNAISKLQTQQNKLYQNKGELANLLLDRDQTRQEYNDKLAKIEGEKYSSYSDAASAEYDIAKLKNTFTNYEERQKWYYIISPIDGQVGSVKQAGIGVIIKEGDFIAEIIPDIHQKAIEIFIDPVDIPLVHIGQKIQFVFDGYPAMLFRGWPQYNFGTFSGEIKVIEKTTSANGKFRALVTETVTDRKWPPHLNIGTGAKGIALLKDVPIYYELWRKINGFPAEFYTPAKTTK